MLQTIRKFRKDRKISAETQEHHKNTGIYYTFAPF